MICSDWISLNRFSRFYQRLVSHFPFLWYAPPEKSVYRNVPASWKDGIKTFTDQFARLPAKAMNLRSLDLVLQGIRQMNAFQFVVTNRLHGHILCVLLEKPHMLLANAYYKNEGFYRAWTSQIPFASFSAGYQTVQIPNKESIGIRGPKDAI